MARSRLVHPANPRSPAPAVQARRGVADDVRSQLDQAGRGARSLGSLAGGLFHQGGEAPCCLGMFGPPKQPTAKPEHGQKLLGT